MNKERDTFFSGQQSKGVIPLRDCFSEVPGEVRNYYALKEDAMNFHSIGNWPNREFRVKNLPPRHMALAYDN